MGARRGLSVVEAAVVMGAIALSAVGGFTAYRANVARSAGCLGQAVTLLQRGDYGCHGSGQEKSPSSASTGRAPKPAGANEPLCEKGGKCEGGQCFAAGTKVATPDGHVPIETLAAGDWVLAPDTESGEIAPHRVVRMIHTPSQPLVRVALASSRGASTLFATPTHPFWTRERGWVAVDALEPGEALGGNGEIRVVALTMLPEKADVWNMEVEGVHTYLAGESDAWVHNDCDKDKEKEKKDRMHNAIVGARNWDRRCPNEFEYYDRLRSKDPSTRDYAMKEQPEEYAKWLADVSAILDEANAEENDLKVQELADALKAHVTDEKNRCYNAAHYFWGMKDKLKKAATSLADYNKRKGGIPRYDPKPANCVAKNPGSEQAERERAAAEAVYKKHFTEAYKKYLSAEIQQGRDEKEPRGLRRLLGLMQVRDQILSGHGGKLGKWVDWDVLDTGIETLSKDPDVQRQLHAVYEAAAREATKNSTYEDVYWKRIQYLQSEKFALDLQSRRDEDQGPLLADQITPIAVINPELAGEIISQHFARSLAQQVDRMSEEELTGKLEDAFNQAEIAEQRKNGVSEKDLKRTSDLTKRAAKVAAQAIKQGRPQGAAQASHALHFLEKLDSKGAATTASAMIGLYLLVNDASSGKAWKDQQSTIESFGTIAKTIDSTEGMGKLVMFTMGKTMPNLKAGFAAATVGGKAVMVTKVLGPLGDIAAIYSAKMSLDTAVERGNFEAALNSCGKYTLAITAAGFSTAMFAATLMGAELPPLIPFLWFVAAVGYVGLSVIDESDQQAILDKLSVKGKENPGSAFGIADESENERFWAEQGKLRKRTREMWALANKQVLGDKASVGMPPGYLSAKGSPSRTNWTPEQRRVDDEVQRMKSAQKEAEAKYTPKPPVGGLDLFKPIPSTWGEPPPDPRNPRGEPQNPWAPRR